MTKAAAWGWAVFGLVWLGCAADSESSRRTSKSNPGDAISAAAGTWSEQNPGSVQNVPGVDGGAGIVLPPTSTPFMRDDTAMSGLDAATIDALKKGGSACNTALLYPYDGTIFPAGLISPLMQWTGAADASYVRVAYENLDTVDYEFAAAGTNPGELRMPQDAWNEITRRTQNTVLKVTHSVKVGDAISTCEHAWRIAPGVMKGSIYYNTYAAPNALNPSQGAVMRVAVGNPTAEIYLQYPGPDMVMAGTGPCISCHSVSANGTTMVASLHNYALSYGGGAFYMGGGGAAMGGKEFSSLVYPVASAAQPSSSAKLPNAEFSALYPDGSRVLAMGNPQCTGGSETFPRAPNNFPLVEGPDHARVLDTATGMEIPANGLDPNWYMWMPQFSPDGKHVAFNHAKPDGKGGTDRRELAVMDYDYATNTFSNLKVVASHLGPEPSLPYMPAAAGAGATPAGIGGCMKDANQSDVAALNPGSCTGPCYPSNPFFTPDGKGVVFLLISEPDFTSAFPGRDQPSKGELWYADIASGKSVLMAKANSSLDPADSLSNYFPTVLPVQVGGYFWAFWTARRSWGNKLDAKGPGMWSIGGSIPSQSMMEAYKKRIWVTAIQPAGNGEVQASGLSDPSAPGFYLEGQSETGNVRAFATLNPCVAAGTSCTSGLDCCTGFCAIAEGAAEGTCTDEVPMCSKTNDKCTTTADCCPPAAGEIANQCLGGFCGFVVTPD